MPTVKNYGSDIYRGFDEGGDGHVTIPPGEEAEVSAAKAKQLARDFPDSFGDKAKKAAELAAEPVADE